MPGRDRAIPRLAEILSHDGTRRLVSTMLDPKKKALSLYLSLFLYYRNFVDKPCIMLQVNKIHVQCVRLFKHI